MFASDILVEAAALLDLVSMNEIAGSY